jgi:hypothetical protein
MGRADLFERDRHSEPVPAGTIALQWSQVTGSPLSAAAVRDCQATVRYVCGVPLSLSRGLSLDGASKERRRENTYVGYVVLMIQNIE